MNILLKIYNLFMGYYGPQGWWPLSCLNKALSYEDKDWPSYMKFTGSEGVLEDFSENWPRHLGIAPQNDRERFEIIIGSILTQNTSWSNVERVLYNLNKEGINTIEKIKNTDRKKLALFIKSAGYHNQKADRLKGLALYFSTEYKSVSRCFNKPLYDLRRELLSLKGIGPETADSIILYSAELPIFVIDAYTKRIFTRILGREYEKYDYKDWQYFFMSSFEREENKVKMFKEYHGLIVKHGKEFCRTVPLCKECMLKKICNCF